jgi:hypothetical protein
MTARELIPVVVNSLISLIGAVLGFFGGLWVYQKGHTDRERSKHLDELKREVLEPMLAYLTNEVIPILEFRLGNIGICEARVGQPTAKVTDSISIRQTFCYQVVTENVSEVLQHVAASPERRAFFDTL